MDRVSLPILTRRNSSRRARGVTDPFDTLERIYDHDSSYLPDYHGLQHVKETTTTSNAYLIGKYMLISCNRLWQ